ncbi:MAG: hypothetical protein COV46_04010 [Deltaproteobacteria bacterium CG11_big_fil_rev_8_21_14_0_20_49_13]|nr:MAG: hypothetical protein COV46_04010 [Deltaproteobacteria bacterium CG11_big_fil_rev_8_21_14_0_20_49_13]
MELQFGKRRAVVLNVKDELKRFNFNPEEINHFEFYDLLYRTLCAIMYNYVPTSGHPGGSISSGRFVQSIIFNTMDYNFTNPDEDSNDFISYAAGHKALGLYAMWAMRNEFVRIGRPAILPKEEKYQMRLEDLLGFRRNPTQETELFKKYKAKALDGHPAPSTPFIKISTGASGVGVATSFGLAMGAIDYFGAANAPHVHVIEGEGGMTPGRVIEAFSFASTAGLKNLTVHIDWNQASIDSNHVTRDETGPGDYVQWDPVEFAYLNDWNVIIVPDGKDFTQVFVAQRLLKEIKNDQPTAIVYRTIKGWKYGIEGRASHGAGHKFCSEGYYAALKDAEDATGIKFPRFEGGSDDNNVESHYFNTLLTLRKMAEANKESANFLAGKTEDAAKRLKTLGRKPRENAPNAEVIYDKKRHKIDNAPEALKLKVGDSITLRGVLGDILNYYNKESGGAILSASADLLGSTSVNNVYKGFPEGFYNSGARPFSRALSVGGICEDGIGGVMSGISAFGKHIGVGSSYAAFIAALQHITMRLHGIGQQARVHTFGGSYHPFVAICAHTGLKTGEDGPTHADPQALQIVQENFPSDVMISLTPWDPQEIWPLMTAALQARPAIITPFVTRPNEKVPDRVALKLAPAVNATNGVYALRSAGDKADGAIVLQESGVTYTFIEQVLPRLDKDGLNLNIYYVASVELFDRLPKDEQDKIFSESLRREAIGITGFTLPTLYKFVSSEKGRRASMHPFMKGHYMGSGQAYKVLEEAGLDGESQYKTVKKFIEHR